MVDEALEEHVARIKKIESVIVELGTIGEYLVNKI